MGREMGRADREMGGRVHLPLGAADVDRVRLPRTLKRGKKRKAGGTTYPA